MQDLKRNFWPFFSIAIVVIIFFWKFFFLGQIPLPADIITGVSYPWRDYFLTSVQNPITSDAVSFSFPMRMLAIDLIKSGKLPLWNPYILFGNPLLANFQSAPFSPTNFLYFIFDKLTAWGLQIILQHFLAATFTYLLLRYWKISRFGSFLGGIIFAFSGFNLIWSPWNAHTLTASFIPLLILFTERFLRSGRWVDGIGISVALAMQVLAGYPQIVLYTLLALILFWGILTWREGQISLRRSLFFFGFILLGLGLSAFQILPGIELLNQSQRIKEAIPREWAFLEVREAVKFISSEYFGNHASHDFWGPKNYTSTVGFIGVTAFSLSLLALQEFKKLWQVRYLIFLIIISLVFSFRNPLSEFLWAKNILGLAAGVSLRIMILFNLSISLLVGIGVDEVGKKLGNRLIAILVPLILLIIFGIYAFYLPDNYGQVALESMVLPFGILIGVSTALFLRSRLLFLPLVLIELFYFGWKYTPFSPRNLVFPRTPVIDRLISLPKTGRVNTNNIIPVDFNMVYGIETSQGYEAVYPERTAQFLATLNSDDPGSTSQDRYGLINSDSHSRLLDLSNVSYTLTLDTKDTRNIYVDRSVGIIKNKSALPRQFFVDKWEVEKDDKKILGKLLDPNFPLSQKIILEEEPRGNPKGFIFVSDTWYPGWKAYACPEGSRGADGCVETRIYRADYVFRAVPVSSPKSKVEFVYQPDSFYNGLKISGISAFVLLILTLSLGRYRFGNINPIPDRERR